MDEAAAVLGDVETDSSELVGGKETLGARVQGLREILRLAEPMARLAEQHLRRAIDTSGDINVADLLDPHTLDRRMHEAARDLGRADEDVRLLDHTVETAAGQAHRFAQVAADLEALSVRPRAARPDDTTPPPPGRSPGAPGR